MNTKNSTRSCARSARVNSPSPVQISRQRVAIQSGWSTREKQRRRMNGKHSAKDARMQAHLRFIQFLVDLDAQRQ